MVSPSGQTWNARPKKTLCLLRGATEDITKLGNKMAQFPLDCLSSLLWIVNDCVFVVRDGGGNVDVYFGLVQLWRGECVFCFLFV